MVFNQFMFLKYWTDEFSVAVSVGDYYDCVAFEFVSFEI